MTSMMVTTGRVRVVLTRCQSQKFGMQALHLVRSAPTVQLDQIQNLQGVLDYLGAKS
jgi:hypothetical protein